MEWQYWILYCYYCIMYSLWFGSGVCRRMRSCRRKKSQLDWMRFTTNEMIQPKWLYAIRSESKTYFTQRYTLCTIILHFPSFHVWRLAWKGFSFVSSHSCLFAFLDVPWALTNTYITSYSMRDVSHVERLRSMWIVCSVCICWLREHIALFIVHYR